MDAEEDQIGYDDPGSFTFNGPGPAESWHIQATMLDAYGGSSQVHRVVWDRVDSFTGSESYLLNLTAVDCMSFHYCRLFDRPSVLGILVHVGLTLVELTFDEGSTTHQAITSLLAGLPHLRTLQVADLDVSDDNPMPGNLPEIPFFQGGHSFNFNINLKEPASLSWIPASPRFRELEVETRCLFDEPRSVDRWIASSAASLETLTIIGDPEGEEFPVPNLSVCTALKSLYIGATVPEPGILVDLILPSISHCPPPKLFLHMLLPESEDFDSEAWEELGERLCQLAKQFKVNRPGSRMEVGVRMGSTPKRVKGELTDWLNYAAVMLRLREDADVTIV